MTVYIVLGVLYESFIHPITIFRRCPRRASAHCWRSKLFHLDLDIVSIIGIILLIGIVKKNGIMMVDFALEAERKGGKNATDAIYEASRPALPAHHDDDHGGAAERHSTGVRIGHRVGIT